MRQLYAQLPRVAVIPVDLELRSRQLLRGRRLDLSELLRLRDVLDVVVDVEHLKSEEGHKAVDNQDPIVKRIFSIKFYSTLEFDQSQCLKKVT